MSARAAETFRYAGLRPTNMAELAAKLFSEADSFARNGEYAKALVRREDADRIEAVAAAMYRVTLPPTDAELALHNLARELIDEIGVARTLSKAQKYERLAANCKLDVFRIQKLLVARALRDAVAMMNGIEAPRAVGL